MNFKTLKDNAVRILKNKYFLGAVIVLVVLFLTAALFFKNSTLMSLASITNSPVFCDGIGDSVSKNTCYFNFALHHENSSVCDKMNNDLVKNLCFAIGKRDSSLCEKVGTLEARDACYLNINRFKPDMFNCPKIQNEVDRDDCFATIAKNKNDIAVCDNIKNDRDKEACTSNFK